MNLLLTGAVNCQLYEHIVNRIGQLQISCTFFAIFTKQTSFMRWELNPLLNHFHHWTLFKNNPIAELKYNKESRSMRLTAADKRLFFLERTGVFQTRILLKTEYSVVVGETHFIKNWSQGFLELDGNKFKFIVKNKQLSVFDRQKQLVAECTMEDLGKVDVYEFSALLFGLVRITQGHFKSKPELAEVLA